MRRKVARQLRLPRTAGWGGRREGAGGKRRKGAGVSHATRARFRRLPVHVTMRVLPHVWNLRSKRCFEPMANACGIAAERFGVRIIDFGVEGNHLHFIVEAEDAAALSRAIQGLTIRLAKALNRVMGRSGKVFADRYHAHLLRTPREVRNAIHYAVTNHAIHARRGGWQVPSGVDPYTSRGHRALRLRLQRPPCVAPQLWLTRRALR